MARAGFGACLIAAAALFAACGEESATGDGGAAGDGGAGDGPGGDVAADGGVGGIGGRSAGSNAAGHGAPAEAPVAGVGGGVPPGVGGSAGSVDDATAMGGATLPIGGRGDSGDFSTPAAGSGAGGSTSLPPAVLSYAALPTSLVRDRCLYDAGRLAVYTNNQAQYFGPPGVPRVERHRFVGQMWVTDSLLLNGPPRDIGLSRDHHQLVAVSPSTIYQIDLDSWSIAKQLDLVDLSDYPYSVSEFSRLAVSGDHTAIVSLGGQHDTLFEYDLTAHTMATTPITVPGIYGIYGGIPPVASGDGSRILFGQNGVSGPLVLYYYDTALAKLVKALPDLTVSRMSYDRTGTTALIDGSVYDEQFHLRGFAADLLVSVISPDGSRGYGYVADGGGAGNLRTYDLTSATPEGQLVEVASRISLPDDPGAFPTLAISDDARTLFLSGESNFIVQPLPDTGR